MQEDLSIGEPENFFRDTTPANHKSPSELGPYMVVAPIIIENVTILNHSTQNHSKLNKHSPKLNIIPLTKNATYIHLNKKRFSFKFWIPKGSHDAAVVHIRSTQGYENIEVNSLKNWQKNRDCRKRRRSKALKSDTDNDVKSLLTTQAMVNITNQESLIIHPNVAFDYKIIKAAVLKAQQCPK